MKMPEIKLKVPYIRNAKFNLKDGLEAFGSHLTTIQNYGNGNFRNFSIKYFENGIVVKYRKMPEIKMDFRIARFIAESILRHINKIELLKEI